MRALALLFSLFCLTISFGSGKPNEFPAHRIAEPPTIDGTVNEAEWAGIPSGTGFLDAFTGEPAPYGGTFWLAYDEKYVYFAAKLDDAEPHLIQATEYRTNVGLAGNDTISFNVDSFGGVSAFNLFTMNASGGTSISIAGGRAPKREWLGEFLAKGRVTETGWEAEARIPWQVMKLPGEGRHTLRFNVRRSLARIRRDFVWQYVGGGNNDQFGKWRDVELPKPESDRSIKLLPYLYGGYNQERQKHISNAGLDLKYSVNENIDLVGTINPDFRNVENQILSIDFSYFERLAGESRPFFLEGQRYIQTGMFTRLFASQRIRQFDVGVNAYGRLNKDVTFGALSTVDFGKQATFVASTQKSFSPTFNVGVATAVNMEPGKNNQGLFLNVFKQFGQHGIYLQSKVTHDQVRGKGHNTSLGYYQQGSGMESSFEYWEISKNHLPRLGFTQDVNFRGFNGGTTWLRPHPRGAIVETAISAFGQIYWRPGGDRYRRTLDLNGSVTWKDGLDLDIGMSLARFQQFDDQLFFMSFEKPRNDPYRRWAAGAVVGRQSGQRYRSVSVGTAYRPVKRFQLAFSGQYVNHFGVQRQAIVGANYDIGQDESISGRAVYNGSQINSYLAYRKSGGRGSEYFVILGDPNARTFQRTLIIKAVFPLTIGG